MQDLLPTTLLPLDSTELQTLADRAADRLRESMITGVLKPGDRLVERMIAEQLGVSKTAVREAFIRLEHEGLVQKGRSKQTRVTLLTAKQVSETNQIRMALEPVALIDAHKYLTDDLVRYFRDLISRMEAANTAADDRGHVSLDLEFHRGFWKLSGNETLLKLLNNICTPLFAFFLMHIRNRPAQFAPKVNSHYALLEAVTEGGDKIRVAIEDHIRKAWYPSQAGDLATLVYSQMPTGGRNLKSKGPTT